VSMSCAAGVGVVGGMGASGVPKMCGWPPRRSGLSTGARRRVRMWAAPHRALALPTRSAPPSIAKQERRGREGAETRAEGREGDHG
jgi:hypothetical protein